MESEKQTVLTMTYLNEALLFYIYDIMIIKRCSYQSKYLVLNIS